MEDRRPLVADEDPSPPLCIPLQMFRDTWLAGKGSSLTAVKDQVISCASVKPPGLVLSCRVQRTDARVPSIGESEFLRLYELYNMSASQRAAHKSAELSASQGAAHLINSIHLARQRAQTISARIETQLANEPRRGTSTESLEGTPLLVANCVSERMITDAIEENMQKGLVGIALHKISMVHEFIRASTVISRFLGNGFWSLASEFLKLHSWRAKPASQRDS